MGKRLIAITSSENGGSISLKADPSGTPQEGQERNDLIKAIAGAAVRGVHIVPKNPKVHQTVYLGENVSTEYPDNITGEKIPVEQFLQTAEQGIREIGEAFSRDDMTKSVHIQTGNKTYTLTKQTVEAL